MKKCHKCGYIEEDNSIPFCAYCGNPITLSWSESQTIKESNKQIFSNKKHTNKGTLSIIGIAFIGVILGTSLYVFSPISLTSPSPSLVIKSVISSPGYGYNSYQGPSLAYSLNMTFTVILPVSTNSEGIRLGCMFSTKLQDNPDLLFLDSPSKGCRSSIQFYKGSYDLNHYAEIKSKNGSNFNYPFTISLSIFSDYLNLTSKPYPVTINRTGFSAITIEKAKINNETVDTGITGYNVSVLFSVVTDHAIKLTNTCRPFTIKLSPWNYGYSNSSTWNLTTFGCRSPTITDIPVGTSFYSMTAQMVDPSGNLYNYSSQYYFPGLFIIQVKLTQSSLASSQLYVSIYKQN